MINVKRFFIIIILIFSFISGCAKKHSEGKYHCPMHPAVVSDRPGTCPICNMDLVPIKNSDEHKDHGSASAGSVQISESSENELGIRTVQVKKSPLSKVIYSAGTVSYEPDIYSAVLEMQIGGAFSSSARLKLEQMGVSESFIREWVSRDPKELIVGGKGTAHIVSVLYENEFSSVKTGSSVQVTSASLPGRIFKGTVRHIDRIPDAKTRTLKVWTDVKDAENLLKPQMFVKTEISSGTGEGLTVPVSSVIDTGERQIVYVRTGKGKFSQRNVRTGVEAGDVLEIKEGLSEGEEIAEYGIFFIDSESRLKNSEETPKKEQEHSHD
ncbi:MAG TPA: efflux RND transporter periplasmic adaptor subunit [Leptospiraceae bacterium]|nr:efflux RND transporter periplasmic adaptor subunit [Leptospiraceae bacterium]